MKKIKYLTLSILIIMVLNITIPVFSLATDKINEEGLINSIKETNNEVDLGVKENEAEKKELDNNKIIEENNNCNTEEVNTVIKEEENKNEQQEVYLQKGEQNIEEQKKENVTEKIENEKFSIFIMDGVNRINLYEKNDNNYIFVPKTLNLLEMKINYTGNIETVENAELNKEKKQITGNFQNESNFTITLSDGQIKNIIIMQSDLPAIHIKDIFTKEDENGNKVEKTIKEVNSDSKEVKYDASILITDGIDEQNNINQKIEFKGRGNYTWNLPKKPYQIKFNKKQSVLGMKKSKTWILLANYMDNSYMRNKTAFDIAKELGLSYTPNYEFVDLWVNGDYLGNYMIVEKIQVDTNRVNLNDENGILVELDNQYYAEEKTWFESKVSKTKFTLKDSYADDESEDNSVAKEAFRQFEKDINYLEQILYAENKDWEKIKSILDIDSFINFYFMQELSEDPDGCRTSVFMYRDGKDDKIHMSPVWDYDSAFGNYTNDRLGGNYKVDYVINIKKNMENSNDWYNQLFKIKEFKKEVSNLYNTKVKSKLELQKNNLNFNLKISANMNNIVWDTLGKITSFGRISKDTYEGECVYFKDWLQHRIEYLNKRYGENSDVHKIKYQSHVQDIGWEKYDAENGETSGTEGQSKRIEAMKIYFDTFNKQLLENAKIKYQGHIQDIGWQEWKNEGEILGTEGQSKRLEAIKIKMEETEKYSIKYRVHIQDIGWQDWKYNGEIAGTEGQSKRIEAIEIEIVEKEIESINENKLIGYKAHIQDIGDTEYGFDGQIVGTTGKDLRLEGINIELNERLLTNISLIIDTHIQDIGWQTGFTDKHFIGTSGKSLRMEAIKISLAGGNSEKYDIKYRVHIQDIGWQDWKQNGEMAGTEGQAKGIEAIQIQLTEK